MTVHDSHKIETRHASVGADDEHGCYTIRAVSYQLCRLCHADDRFGSLELESQCRPRYDDDGKPLFTNGFAVHCDEA